MYNLCILMYIRTSIIFGKLDGIAQQIIQNLLQSLGIRFVPLRHICANIGSDPQSSPRRISLHLNGRRDTIQRRLQIHGRSYVQVEIARGEFGVIQDIVHDCAQEFARRGNHAHGFFLKLIEWRVVQERGHADNAIQWCSVQLKNKTRRVRKWRGQIARVFLARHSTSRDIVVVESREATL